jgi:hypothetical protein
VLGLQALSLLFELKDLFLLKQELSHLSPDPSPFYFSYFLKSSFIYALAGLDHAPPPIKSSPVTKIVDLNYHAVLLLAEMGGLVNFLLGMVWNHGSHDFYLFSSWDYRFCPMN